MLYKCQQGNVFSWANHASSLNIFASYRLITEMWLALTNFLYKSNLAVTGHFEHFVLRVSCTCPRCVQTSSDYRRASLLNIHFIYFKTFKVHVSIFKYNLKWELTVSRCFARVNSTLQWPTTPTKVFRSLKSKPKHIFSQSNVIWFPFTSFHHFHQFKTESREYSRIGILVYNELKALGFVLHHAPLSYSLDN